VTDRPEPRRPTPIYAADEDSARADPFVTVCNLIVAAFALWVLAHIFFPDLGARL